MTALAFLPNARAQYPAGLSSTGPESAAADKKAREAKAAPGGYNLKLGQIKFRLGLGIREEYNDNITLTKGANQDGDTITTPGVSVNIFWPFSKLNTLDITLGIEYSKYWNHPELDSQSLIITPNSLLDFNIYVGDVRFNIYDKISLQEDPISQPQLSGTSKFRRLENTAGLKIDWDLNLVIPTLGFEHYTFKALNNGQVSTVNGTTFGGLDHDTDSIFGGLGFRLNPRMMTGVRANYSETKYTGTQQNGSTSMSAAAFLDGQITQYITLSASAGYQVVEFSSGGSINDNTNFGSYIFSLAVRQELNRFYEHNLAISRYETPGIGTNFTEITEANYGFSWELIKDYELSGSAFYQMYQNSGDSAASDSGDRYGVSLQASHQLMRRWRLSLGYDFIAKTSNEAQNDYMQNRIHATLKYTF